MGSVKTEVFVLFVILLIELSNWSIMEHCEIKIKQSVFEAKLNVMHFQGHTLFLPILQIPLISVTRKLATLYQSRIPFSDNDDFNLDI